MTKTNFPLVSILLPVRNEGAYLAQCLESLLQQRYKNIEIILCDNCSDDNSYDIARSYAKKDNRLKIFHQHYLVEAYSNLSLCFQQSSGYLIFLIGGDDYIDDDLVEKSTIKFIENSHIFAVITKLRYFNDINGRRYKLPRQVSSTML
jgi:glycosyltransferase involved in cell wall biosynthesis